ncbi:hypothetical protein [Sphingobacterium suaedae]|uniref:Outer membrane protein beta-barrel domain-containing protein n=1 Tax=Sphingobacterium suaedae TaxID=1686402 RepID=A0ABW5KBG4_9SPHI
MKNILLSVIAILMLSMVQGQTEFGLKAGANFASYKYATSDQLVDASPRTSFYIGGYLNTPMTQRIDLHPEISLQGKGAKLKESSNWGNAKVTQRVVWLDFTANVLVKYPRKMWGTSLLVQVRTLVFQ